MFSKRTGLDAKKYSSGKGYNSKIGKAEKAEGHNHPKGKATFDDKQETLLSNELKEQTTFVENFSSEYIRNEKIPDDYLNEKL